MGMLRALWKLLPGPWDLHVWGGAALMAAGLWQWSPAISMTVLGAALSALGLVVTKPWRT